MQEGIEQNALELLQAIREHHPDIYAGAAWVNPYTAALEDLQGLLRGQWSDATHIAYALLAGIATSRVGTAFSGCP
jgi:hypothetical protein